MHNAATVLTDFVMSKLSGETLSTRARIYRALADLAAPADRKRLRALARECDAIEAAHEQLAFDFRQGSKRRDNNGSNGGQS